MIFFPQEAEFKNLIQTNIKYIVGLGNPLPKYSRSPHNLGFIFIDTMLIHNINYSKLNLREQHGWQLLNGLVITKPTTYMNLSGRAVRELYKMSNVKPIEFVRSLLIVHDEISLPMHSIRYKDGIVHSGLGGHNGLRSIVSELRNLGLTSSESTSFHRLRLGCDLPRHSDLATYILDPMSKSNYEQWVKILAEYNV